MSYIKSFTTQWMNENIKITYLEKGIFNFFIRVFFKNWIKEKNKNYLYEIDIDFKKQNNNLVNTFLFDYTRKMEENKITTTVSNIKIFRSIIRSTYKVINKKASVVGVSELYMAIIRKTIIEPIEYFNYQQGWRLLHASVFKFNNKLFVISAGSKVGKSTLVSKLIEKHDCEILSDNYCFIKGNMVRTIEEPMRGGESSRYKMSFYNRTINGYPSCFENEINYLILMKRGVNNCLSKLEFSNLNLIINKINNQEKEGVLHLDDKDVIKIKNNKITISGSYSLFELEVAEGIENINTSINLLKKIQ